MKDALFFRLFPQHTILVMALVLASVCGFSNTSRAVSGSIYMITSDPNYEAGTNGFAGFLRGLGYSVTVEPAGGGPYRTLNTSTNAAQLIAELEAYDLIIIHRNFGSGTLNSDNATGVERGIWNKMNVPILLCNGPIARGNPAVWRWYDGQSGTLTVPKDILIEAPGTHPIIAGLTGSLFNNNRIYGGVFNGTDGGTNMEVLARVDLSAFGNPICLAVWDEAPGGTELRGFYAAGGETYYRRRVFFELHEYRNTPISPDPWLEVTANGRLMFAQAVQFTMYGVVTPPPVVNNLTPADQTANHVASDGLSFDAVSPLAISDADIRVKLNGSNVAAGLAFSGPNTSRHVSYSGLISNFFYNVEITVSNVTGSRTVFAQFDTFVPAQTFTMTTINGINYSDFPPAGNFHAFLRVAAASARESSLYLGSSTSDPLVSVFYVPATASMATFTYVPLTDALGALNVLRFNGSSYTFFLDPVDNVTVVPSDLVFVPAANVPATLRPILARTRPIPNTSTSSPVAAITMDLVNRDTSVQGGTVDIRLAGNDVTASASINYTFDGASVIYQPPVFLKPGSNYATSVSFTDETATSTTNAYSFAILSMPAIPADYRTASGTGADRGFNIRNHMEPTNSAGRVFTNTVVRAELQLAGLFGTNEINGTPLPASTTELVAINYAQANGSATARFPGDIIFPGGENLAASLNIALEATTYVDLPAGVNRFGVRSVDGFKLTAGASFASQDVVLFAHEGPRGNQVPSEFDFLVYESGTYALRLLYFAGGGGATVEWYGIYEGNVSPDGMDGRVLINTDDINTTTPAPAYQFRTAEPVGPGLTATRVGNAVLISWTSSYDHQLQFKTSLSASMWMPVLQTPVVNGNLHTVTISNPTGTVFYRLQSQ